MKRLFVAVLCLGALVACKKETPAPEATAPSDTAKSAQQGSAQKDDEKKEAEADEGKADDDDAPKPSEPEEKLVVTDELLTRFLGYWDKTIDAASVAMKDMNKAAQESDKKGGAMGAAHAMQASNSISERMESTHDALLKEYSLTETQARDLQELCTAIGMQTAILKQGNLEGMIADLKKQVAALPPDKQAEGQKQVAELEQSFKDQMNFADLRQRFGDQAVDLAVKRKDDIIKVHQKAFGMLK